MIKMLIIVTALLTKVKVTLSHFCSGKTLARKAFVHSKVLTKCFKQKCLSTSAHLK